MPLMVRSVAYLQMIWTPHMILFLVFGAGQWRALIPALLPFAPPSHLHPHPREDVTWAKLTVILRLWRPVTGCFELKQKTHYNPKRRSGNDANHHPLLHQLVPQPDPQPGSPPPTHNSILLLDNQCTSQCHWCFIFFYNQQWKKCTNKLLGGKHSTCASAMVS